MQFNVEQLSVEVQSRGRSVAELQVAGVQVSYCVRNTIRTIRLAVHSLLLVDAMQTLGSDYELLVASHKQVCMDSMSGSLASPVSPSSPDPCSQQDRSGIMGRPGTAGATGYTSAESLARALSCLQADPRWRDADAGKSEALILIDVTMVEPGCAGAEDRIDDGRIRIVNVNFNSLDVTANQDTVVELASFFQRILPANRSDPDPGQGSHVS